MHFSGTRLEQVGLPSFRHRLSMTVMAAQEREFDRALKRVAKPKPEANKPKER